MVKSTATELELFDDLEDTEAEGPAAPLNPGSFAYHPDLQYDVVRASVDRMFDHQDTEPHAPSPRPVRRARRSSPAAGTEKPRSSRARRSAGAEAVAADPEETRPSLPRENGSFFRIWRKGGAGDSNS